MTAASRQRRVQGLVPGDVVLGITLLAIAAIVVTGFLVDDLDRFTLLGVSLVTFIAFGITREYGFAIPAGFTGGLGTFVLWVTSATPGSADTPAVLFLLMGGAFAVIWLLGLVARPREVHPWPLVPAAILGGMGLAFATRQPGAIDWVVAAIAVAVAAAGLRLLLRRGAEG